MFRNKEFQQLSAFFCLITTITVLLGFQINTMAGILIFASSAIWFLTFSIYTKNRYQRIADISEQIDQILHNAEHLYITESDEGELSILQSEITKMTLRIKEQNEALRKSKEHLADSLADIAHQLRTPLTSANLILSLLEKDLSESMQKSLLREIKGLFLQMEWLINSLLKLSRLDAGVVIFQSNPVNVNDLVNTAARPLLISMELHNIVLQTNIPSEMVISGDLSWLSEALLNILKNCIQKVVDNGKVEIICKNTLLFHEIVIHDSGIGFDEKALPHLFDRFYRGKNEGATGYGIGLALSKMIITRHNGTITAKNHPQGGAIFCIRFPK